MNVLLVVSGGIAVYKSLDIVSKLVKKGHNVKVIMTNNAQKFVTDLSFQTLSKNRVYTDTFYEINEQEIQHIDLGKWADKILVAPATANIIAKIANGIADDLATSTILAYKNLSNVYIVPAMNTNMLENPITQENINKLAKLGVNFIDSAEGMLACGDFGKGKFPDTESVINSLFFPQNLIGKKVLVTAGATKEYIDPVRYISNPSSGKMGIAIAEEFAKHGATVYLITSASYNNIFSNIKLINIVSAEDMFNEVLKYYEQCDIVVKSAAVSDYTPLVKYDKKVKKQEGNINIELGRTVDILKYIGENKKDSQILVGFAAETNNVIDYAKEKLKIKNLDYIVANDVSKSDIGFSSDNNEVHIIDKFGNIENLNKDTKKNIAKKIVQKIIK